MKREIKKIVIERFASSESFEKKKPDTRQEFDVTNKEEAFKIINSKKDPAYPIMTVQTFFDPEVLHEIDLTLITNTEKNDNNE